MVVFDLFSQQTFYLHRFRFLVSLLFFLVNSCKYGIPALKRAGGGSIINTASFVALLGAATPQVGT